MPLLFASKSHAQIPFGFYNIETDGLLCDNLFFFSTDFCEAAVNLGDAGSPGAVVDLKGHVFDDPSAIGDLHGAINGTHLTGYLGELYSRWPFPDDLMAFRQHGDSFKNRKITQKALAGFAKETVIPVRYNGADDEFRLGPYVFTPEMWRELLLYVLRGGYPTWDNPPEYVQKLIPVIKSL